MFLVGDFSMLRDRFGTYPEVVTVKEGITKRDLTRARESHDFQVIDLDKRTFFDAEKNRWLPLGK